MGPSGAYSPDPAADWHLFAGDEAAIPAISVALEALPCRRHRPGVHRGRRSRRRDRADRARTASRSTGFTAAAAPTWYPRIRPAINAPLIDAVKSAPWLPGQVQVFIHGEAQTVMHNLRPYIRKERGVEAKWASSISGLLAARPHRGDLPAVETRTRRRRRPANPTESATVRGVHPSFEVVLDDFAEYLALERGRSAHTQRAYLGDLRSLFEFLAQRAPDAGPECGVAAGAAVLAGDAGRRRRGPHHAGAADVGGQDVHAWADPPRPDRPPTRPPGCRRPRRTAPCPPSFAPIRRSTPWTPRNPVRPKVIRWHCGTD